MLPISSILQKPFYITKFSKPTDKDKIQAFNISTQARMTRLSLQPLVSLAYLPFLLLVLISAVSTETSVTGLPGITIIALNAT
jgi:hypothetical protein